MGLQRYPVLTGKTETEICLHRPNQELEHTLFLVSFLIFFSELTVVAPTDEILIFSLTSKHPLTWMDSYK